MRSKKSAGGEIPVKILKEIEILTNCNNQSVDTSNFPDCLKKANITQAFKKDDSLDKLNYRPVSILPLLSKSLRDQFIINYLTEFYFLWLAQGDLML